MAKRLENKRAVITGGTTGLGFETAKRYIKEGARVLITGRTQEKVDAAVAKLGKSANPLLCTEYGCRIWKQRNPGKQSKSRNCTYPIFSNSNLGEKSYNHFAEMVLKVAPLGRARTPLEIANAAVYLGSDESSYITAADLMVDGGWMNV